MKQVYGLIAQLSERDPGRARRHETPVDFLHVPGQRTLTSAMAPK